MLNIDDIHTYYGDSYVLQGVSMEVNEGFTVALVGRNGVGKTTTIRSIIGFTHPRRGSVFFKGKNITKLESYQIARMGVGLIPQGRRIFPSLSVKENLIVSSRKRSKTTPWLLDRVYSFFPVLKERTDIKGNLLSGGEQQMLAIGRALMTNPDMLLMDEPSEGLAPILVRKTCDITLQLKKEKLPIILVEQNIPMVLEVADYVYVMTNGEIVYGSTSEEFRDNEHIKAEYLGVSGKSI